MGFSLLKPKLIPGLQGFSGIKNDQTGNVRKDVVFLHINRSNEHFN
jgi:hypothetical protein